MRAVLMWLLAMGWWTACATAAPPRELSEAHSLYRSAIHDDPQGWREARRSLDEADRAFESSPGSARAQAAAREALTRVHRVEFMAQLARLDEAMAAVLAADARGEPYGTGYFNRRPEVQREVGALGAAVGGLGGLTYDAGTLTLELPVGALFEHGDGELTAAARARLEQAAEAFERHTPDAQVRVIAVGYTRFDPARAGDQARAVREYLIESGVAPGQVTFAMGHPAQSHPAGRMTIMVRPPLDVPR